jgi:hypothetical protein
MAIQVDLNGAAQGFDTNTAFTEQTIITLFPSATINPIGIDAGNTIDTITITLAGATGTERKACPSMARLKPLLQPRTLPSITTPRRGF